MTKNIEGIDTDELSDLVESLVKKELKKQKPERKKREVIPGTNIGGNQTRHLIYLAKERGFLNVPPGYEGLRSYFGAIKEYTFPFFDVSNLTDVLKGNTKIGDYLKKSFSTKKDYRIPLINPAKIHSGLNFLMWGLYSYAWLVDRTIHQTDIPYQDVTSGEFQIQVNGVAFYQIVDPFLAIREAYNIEDLVTGSVASNLCKVIKEYGLFDVNSIDEKKDIAEEVRNKSNEYLESEIGVYVSLVGIKESKIPEHMEEAFARKILAKTLAESMDIIGKAEQELYAKALTMANHDSTLALKFYHEMNNKQNVRDAKTAVINLGNNSSDISGAAAYSESQKKPEKPDN